MKIKSFIVSAAIVTVIPAFALAGGKNCPKPKPQPTPAPQTSVNVNANPTAIAGAVAGSYSKSGAEATANQLNSQNNTQLNKQTNNQQTTQVNSQNAVQANKQAQSNTNSQATTTDVNQVVEAAPNYLTGPDLLQSNPQLTSGKADDSKLFGRFMLHGASFTAKQAAILAGDGRAVKINLALITDYNYKNVGSIKEGTDGEFMGYLYATPANRDATEGAIEGAAMKAALYAGATSMRRVHSSKVETSAGSAWNIGIGGGASMTAGSQGTAIAPNGGLGYGQASAHNELLPSAVYALYCDKASLVEVHYHFAPEASGH
jgi:hypothetical protein